MKAHALITALLYLYEGFHKTSAQINVVTLEVNNLLHLQKGLGWPSSLSVTEGQEGLLKLRSVPENQDSCTVVTPTGISFDVRSPPNNRYESWSDGCGVRIRNVMEADSGRWRLAAKKGNDTLSGWVPVFVEKVPSNHSNPTITIQDGQKTEIHLSNLDNTYCVVEQPFSESTLVPGECKVTLDRASRAVQGNWNVLIGALGRVEEIHLTRQVTVATEKLDFGYIHDTTVNKLHLYCNILHSEKNITFCRFQRTNSASGLNVMDGLGDGKHSYFGEGFIMKQCGITIEQPVSEDFATWRCSVGSQQWDGTGSHLTVATPMQALISVAPLGTRGTKTDASSADDAEMTTVFVQEDQSFTLMCRAKVSLAYCWFQHPNGTQFTPVKLVDEEAQTFWYTGESLQVGDCGITFNHAKPEEEGQWTCHMAPSEHIGIELTDSLYVRVTGPLAAVRNNITAEIGEKTTLLCHTSNGNKPLEYCRFLTPQSVGLSVDSTVTVDNAILDRYYFPAGRSLDHGDCSLTIDPLTEADVGLWTCAAFIADDSLEARDTLLLHVSTRKRSRALILSISLTLSVLALAIAGYLVIKHGFISKALKKLTRRPTAQSQLPMDVLSTNTSVMRCSCGSSSSISTTSSTETTNMKNTGFRA